MALKMPQLLLPAWQCGSEPWASAGSSGFPVTSVKVKWKLLRRVWLFATPRTVACYTPLSWSSPGKNTGVGCRSLLQGIFLTQEGIKPGSAALQMDSLPAELPGKPSVRPQLPPCAFPTAAAPQPQAPPLEALRWTSTPCPPQLTAHAPRSCESASWRLHCLFIQQILSTYRTPDRCGDTAGLQQASCPPLRNFKSSGRESEPRVIVNMQLQSGTWASWEPGSPGVSRGQEHSSEREEDSLSLEEGLWAGAQGDNGAGCAWSPQQAWWKPRSLHQEERYHEGAPIQA